MSNQRSHAVVMGASLSGLLVARVLSNHFEKVTVLERDTLPNGPEFRSGVPQSRHIHILLVKGRQIFDQYFPGYSEELIASGAVPADIGNEFLYVTMFGPLAPFAAGLNLLLCSRYLMEWKVRERLQAFPNVQILPQVDVTGFLVEKDRVAGLQYQPRGTKNIETLNADFTVDASGRVSKTDVWLAALGYPRPKMTVVDSHLGYSTRWYKQLQGYNMPWKGVLIGVTPPHNPRGGGWFMLEGGRWAVTLAGTAGVYPPTDEAGFLEFARQLDHPSVYEAICEAEPISQIYGYRRTENQWRHYEDLKRWPGGLIVIGDAVCCFNPVYGQGMTAAALGASLLDDQLQAWKDDFSPRFGITFQRQLARLLQTPWLVATGEDFRWENTTGDRPGGAARSMQRYIDQVIKLATMDPHAQRRFIEVIHLLKPPSSLFHPRILFPALRHKMNEERVEV
jgi:flavin-dependent dehydrogenase